MLYLRYSRFPGVRRKLVANSKSRRREGSDGGLRKPLGPIDGIAASGSDRLPGAMCCNGHGSLLVPAHPDRKIENAPGRACANLLLGTAVAGHGCSVAGDEAPARTESNFGATQRRRSLSDTPSGSGGWRLAASVIGAAGRLRGLASYGGESCKAAQERQSPPAIHATSLPHNSDRCLTIRPETAYGRRSGAPQGVNARFARAAPRASTAGRKFVPGSDG